MMSKVISVVKTYGLSVFLIIFYAMFSMSVQELLGISAMSATAIGNIAMILIALGTYSSLRMKHKGEEFLVKKFLVTEKKFWIIIICSFLYVFFALTASCWMSSIMVDAGMTSRENTISSSVQHGLAYYALLTCMLSPIAEEVIYRLCLYNLMKSSSNWIVAMTVSSLIFGASHGTLFHLIFGTIFGMFLVLIYEQTGRNIFVSMLSHMIYNFMALFMRSSMLPYKIFPVVLIFVLVILVGLVLLVMYTDRDMHIVPSKSKKHA